MNELREQLIKKENEIELLKSTGNSVENVSFTRIPIEIEDTTKKIKSKSEPEISVIIDE